MAKRKENASSPRSPREKPILLGYAVQRRGAGGRVEVSIRWGRVFATLAALFVLAWVSVAGLLYFYFKYNKDFDDVRFTGMLALPFRMDEHREEMGDFHVSKGLAELEERNLGDAIRLLRLGVSRSPGNLEGRQALSQLYEFGLKRPEMATELLVQGLEHGGAEKPDYLRNTVRTLLRHQRDEKIQELANRYLPEEPGEEPTTRERTLAFAAANASFLRGNYDRAEDYLSSYGLINSVEGMLLSARISWDRGSRDSAIQKLEQALNRFSETDPILLQLSRYHREMGNIDEARRYAILRNVGDPLSPEPRIELLHIYKQAGKEERVDRETRRMLRQFRDEEEALQKLANFAANTGDIELARRTYEEALENEFPIDSFALLLIESHLADGDFEGGIQFAEELLKEKPDWLQDRWAIFNGLRAVAAFGVNRPDLGDIYIEDFLQDQNVDPRTHLAVAQRFESIDRKEQARKILLKSHERAPSNQKVLTKLIRLELELGNTENLNQLITRLLQMRRPKMDLLADAYRSLGSDRFIFTPERENLLLQLGSILRENRGSLPAFDS